MLNACVVSGGKIKPQRNRYVPDLTAYAALCERNYARLQVLLPEEEPCQGQQRAIGIGSHSYLLQVIECTRYTTVVALQRADERVAQALTPWVSPSMRVRLYHDARMAEVCASQQIWHFKGRYDYPNRQMLQQDEKYQVNRLLADWLSLCLERGRLGDPVYVELGADKDS